MNLHKTFVVLLALLLAAMTMVPMVSAAEEQTQSTGSDQGIVELFEPINTETENMVAMFVTTKGFDKTRFNSTDLSKNLINKYQKNLNKIVDSLEKKAGQKLSAEEREDLKQIIVQENIEKVSWAQFKDKLGVKDEDFKPLHATDNNPLSQYGDNQLLSLPLSLTLVQVSADVDGGVGLDGGLRPYNVNGDNDLFSVTVDTSYSGMDLYECHFYDEDVPYPNLDYDYDLFRLAEYGTLQDLQGFFIYDPNPSGQRYIEFGNDWDNGNSYGTVVGQHGAATLSWSVGTQIYISNVWNHAMGLVDRNSNMAKYTYYYS
jgi:hypothetical protein